MSKLKVILKRRKKVPAGSKVSLTRHKLVVGKKRETPKGSKVILRRRKPLGTISVVIPKKR